MLKLMLIPRKKTEVTNEKKVVEEERISIREAAVQLTNTEDEEDKEVIKNEDTTESDSSEDVFKNLKEEIPEIPRCSKKERKPVVRLMKNRGLNS